MWERRPTYQLPCTSKKTRQQRDTWEVQQDSESTLECDRTFFLCKDGTECVSFEYLCDGDKDCLDGSDEMDCSEVCDEPDAYKCQEGTICIQGLLRCDGIAQCPDESDEVNCFEESESCSLWCDNHQRCIPSHWICDGSEDCSDKTDERDCGCSNDDFTCDDGQCISLAFHCDLKYDCRDKSDERNCFKPKKVICKPDEKLCPVSKECIIKEWWCDDYVDCGDGMDEQSCESSEIQCRKFQWMCNNTQCIPNFWHCDGLKDCKDGSDETTCQPRQCKSSELKCTTSECINMNLVCNGKPDCSDISDEGGDCDLHECINCTNICYNTPKGPSCGCPNGFKLVPDSHSCVGIDECKELATRPCSQMCVNKNGTYSCSCYPHYLLNNDGKSCKVTGAEPVLLASDYHDVLLYRLHGGKKDIISAIAKSIMFPLDYDWKEQVIFWIDTYSESINWIKMDQNDQGMLIKGIQSECLAVDWVGRNLYWAEGAAGRILAVSLNSTWHEIKERVVVIDTAIDQPCSLVLQPLSGLMYWSEIGSQPHIERAGMDGTNRKVIIKQGLGWPTSLTLDLIDWKLFWADGKLHCIGVSNLDGTEMKVMSVTFLNLAYATSLTKFTTTLVIPKIFQLAYTRRPFGLAIFEDDVYWSDVELRSIQKADKRLGKNRTVLLKHGQPYSLKVMHEVLQPTTVNPCEQMGCSHFCLLGPGMKGSCHCGPEMLLADDGLTCVKSDEPSLLMISPTVLAQSNGCIELIEGLDVYLKHQDKLKVLPEHLNHQLLNMQVTSADYIWKDNMVYFANSEGFIGQLVMGPNIASWQKILQVDSEITSLTVDWLGQNLYFITSRPCAIEVTSINDLHRLVLIANLSHSTSLALHPPSGIMCFSEWGSKDKGDGPRIECSLMDGQKRRVVWKKCRRPTDLIITESGDRLYWIDLDRRVINSVLLDGSEFKEVKTNLDEHSVFAYGESTLFWTTVDNGDTKLWYSAMENEQQWFEIERKIVGLKIYHRRQGSNFCSEENGGCSHLCLARPGGRTCRCSTGYHLVSGACEAMQCPQQTLPCLDRSSCILNEHVCDGEKHCRDGSDEIKCDVMGKEPVDTSSIFPNIATLNTYFSQITTSRRLPVSPTTFRGSWFPHTDADAVTSSYGVSLHDAMTPSPVANKTDGDFNATEAGRSKSCTPEGCNMHGECYVVDDLMMCKCQEGYTGSFCEDLVGPEIGIPIVLGILAVVLLFAITAFILKRRAGKRRDHANLQFTAAGREDQIRMDEAYVEVLEVM
ncbi:very low-density lipoprotein receptor-like [Amblyraja radiata]|uniref:very low-density lipoprotein receptor-like n=1 Tax=Amblyraja radiata TaxID=386614 RepID=UPI001402EE56|nr:very low-density lipoprotein receptor-like [Amblyraja radiata]